MPPGASFPLSLLNADRIEVNVASKSSRARSSCGPHPEEISPNTQRTSPGFTAAVTPSRICRSCSSTLENPRNSATKGWPKWRSLVNHVVGVDGNEKSRSFTLERFLWQKLNPYANANFSGGTVPIEVLNLWKLNPQERPAFHGLLARPGRRNRAC